MPNASRPWLRIRRLCFKFLVGLGILGCVDPLPRIATAQITAADESAHFAYNANAPLGVKQVAVKVRGRVMIQDITYAGSDGDTVPAYLVVPEGPGKFAGILWGHWLMPGAPNSNRNEFLDEALALAPHGVVSLLIDAPQSRPNFKPTANPLLVATQVIDLRRGLDLLLSRPDIDATRIAYVGHSWNSGTGAILDAVDKRPAAFVFMSGPQSMREYVLSSDSPRMLALRKTADMAKVEQSMKTNAWADPATYAGQLGPSPALFQYGLHDEEWVPLADAKDYLAMSSGPKTVDFYDTDHGLNAQARRDRDEFLSEALKLIPRN